MKVPFVTVFTMTYNQREKVLRLARDLAAQDHPAEAFEFIVLDDGGTDGTEQALQEIAAQLPYDLRVLCRSREGDYLSARRWNECIAAAATDTSVFVQVDDVRVRPDFVSRQAGWHAQGEPLVVTGAKFEGDDVTWELGSCRRAHLADPGGSAGVTTLWTAFWGASLSYPRSLVDELTTGEFERPFDMRMTGWGFHEVEFACRAANRGARLIYDPMVGVFHQNHTPANDRGRGLDHARQKAAGAAKNEAYVLRKHGLTELPRW